MDLLDCEGLDTFQRPKVFEEGLKLVVRHCLSKIRNLISRQQLATGVMVKPVQPSPLN